MNFYRINGVGQNSNLSNRKKSVVKMFKTYMPKYYMKWIDQNLYHGQLKEIKKERLKRAGSNNRDFKQPGEVIDQKGKKP